MKKFYLSFLLVFSYVHYSLAQEYFTISNYDVNIKVNKDASLDIEETILVHFTEQRHGILRFIPYKYRLQPLPEGVEKADRQLESGRETHTIIEDIKVEGWNYEVNNNGDYKVIKIGSKDKYVAGDQKYVIHYRILNTINFFKDYSELYFNVIGDKWATTIDSVNFSVSLYEALPNAPVHFVATGPFGSTENNTVTHWADNKIFSGSTTKGLGRNEGLTVGIRFPKDYLVQPNYRLRGVFWLLLPVFAFIALFRVWKRWGKDDVVTIQTEYYPPKNISPSVSGYVIDEKLNQRDLTALVPYWGAGGYLQIKEMENSSLFGLIKRKEYQFIKIKELPPEAMSFEKTMFNGIFKSGSEVMLSDLKNVLYKTMAAAKSQLEAEVDKSEYYVKGSRGLGMFFIIMGIVLGAFGTVTLLNEYYENIWRGIALFVSGILLLFFGFFMSKKTKKGTLLYQQLAGFKEFIKSVERDRLKEFLKQDEQYFDKILPYAIVFGVADTWKDKLDGLNIPPPTWYSGNYHTFNTGSFMHSLNDSMNTMSQTFFSAPCSRGCSGGSFGGGGSSGGGSGGGGG
ncbi:MAG: DUF2207 domain-containing protein, partial [Flavisolibacter sp.]|nr:DUF2207 domain-containing protein [Flavisolibacter sp.]